MSRMVISEKPLNTVMLAAFFIGGERDNNVALGNESFLFQMNQGGDPDRGHCLVVAGAAAVEIIALLGE